MSSASPTPASNLPMAAAAVASAVLAAGCPQPLPCLDNPAPGQVLSLRLWEPYDEASQSRFDPHLRPTILGCGNADGIKAGQTLRLKVTEDMLEQPGSCSSVVVQLPAGTGWQVIGRGERSSWVPLDDAAVIAKVRKGECEAYYYLGVGSPTGSDRFAAPTRGELPPAIVSRSFEALNDSCAELGIPTGSPPAPDACADYWVASFEQP